MGFTGRKSKRTQMKGLGTQGAYSTRKLESLVGSRKEAESLDRKMEVEEEHLTQDNPFPNFTLAKTPLVIDAQRLQSYERLLAIKTLSRVTSRSGCAGHNNIIKTSMRKIQAGQACCVIECSIFQIPTAKQKIPSADTS
ncbi:hypothetical protein P7K49_027495 [Saguinus oedipus]|uniref:Uncharacterized protein n=1 Tax=Saguinus oedipus TaxID=9490 RepID=A0ABQ9UBR5_SAGOE|nr:hypothetical protein P7K49_027495 [Saguinus oedipus]